MGANRAEPACQLGSLLLTRAGTGCADLQELHLGSAFKVDGVMVVVKESVSSLDMVLHVHCIAGAQMKRVSQHVASTTTIFYHTIYCRVDALALFVVQVLIVLYVLYPYTAIDLLVLYHGLHGLHARALP